MSLSNVYKSMDSNSVHPFTVYPMTSLKLMKEGRQDDNLFLEKEGYEKGFALGEKAGLEFGKEKMNGIIKKFSSLLEDLQGSRKTLVMEKEKEIVELVIAVARKVIRQELTVNMDTVVSVAKSAIDILNDTDQIRVTFNPDDMEYLRLNRPDFIKELEEKKGISLESDPSVDRGGCLAHSKSADVDARIEEGLKVIESAMKENLVN